MADFGDGEAIVDGAKLNLQDVKLSVNEETGDDELIGAGALLRTWSAEAKFELTPALRALLGLPAGIADWSLIFNLDPWGRVLIIEEVLDYFGKEFTDGSCERWMMVRAEGGAVFIYRIDAVGLVPTKAFGGGGEEDG